MRRKVRPKFGLPLPSGGGTTTTPAMATDTIAEVATDGGCNQTLFGARASCGVYRDGGDPRNAHGALPGTLSKQHKRAEAYEVASALIAATARVWATMGATCPKEFDRHPARYTIWAETTRRQERDVKALGSTMRSHMGQGTRGR